MMEKTHVTDLYRKLLKSLLLLMLLGPVSLAAQDRSLQNVVDRASQAGMDRDRISEIQQRANQSGIGEQDLAALLEPAVELVEQNLPADFVIRKMMEGFAKNVPAGRMSPVLESIREKTPQAALLADNWMAKPEVNSFMKSVGENQSRFRRDLISANLKSLSQNVDAGVLEGVLSELGQESVLRDRSPQAVVAAVGVLPDLPESVLQEGGVRAVLARAVGSGFSASDLQKLPGAMNAAERRSQLPAASILNGMSDQIGNGVPANQILQNLFNGNINAGPPEGIPGRPDKGPPGSRNGSGSGNGGF
ncbi:MAG: hypothetical protein R6V27_05145 [Balneolaceae bacterium]